MRYFLFVAAVMASLFPSFILGIQSKPFYLELLSDDAKFNKKVLNACHEGAGFEGLCVYGSINGPKTRADVYQLNYTRGYAFEGILNYNLVANGGKLIVPSGMVLTQDPFTNVAIALFTPGEDYTGVGFDSSEKMYLRSYLNDTVSPPKATDGKDLYRWFACDYEYDDYTYPVLSWTYGIYPPQNPSCSKVDVQRVFKK